MQSFLETLEFFSSLPCARLSELCSSDAFLLTLFKNLSSNIGSLEKELAFPCAFAILLVLSGLLFDCGRILSEQCALTVLTAR